MLFTFYQRYPIITASFVYTMQVVAALPLLLAVISSNSDAAEWKVDGKIDQSLAYDDNVRMTKIPQGSMIYRLTPRLNFARKTDSWDIETDASYGVLRYTAIEERNQEPQSYGLNTVYRAERSNFGLSSNYSITPSRDIAEEDSGNFTSNADRENWTVSPSYSYRLTERDSVISSASYSKSTYSTTAFDNNESQSINLGWQRQWSERLNYSVSAFYSKFKSTGQEPANTDSGSYGINLSANYLLSEKWQLKGTVGGRMTDTTKESEVIPGVFIKDQSTSAGFLADLSANYRGEKLSSSFGFSRSLVPSGLGALTEQSLVRLDLSYQLNERLSSNMGASYRKTDSVSDLSNGLNRTNITLSPGINWKLTEDWIVSASYQYRRQERKTPNTISADSDLFMLGLNYNWPGLSISR